MIGKLFHAANRISDRAVDFNVGRMVAPHRVENDLAR